VGKEETEVICYFRNFSACFTDAEAGGEAVGRYVIANRSHAVVCG